MWSTLFFRATGKNILKIKESYKSVVSCNHYVYVHPLHYQTRTLSATIVTGLQEHDHAPVSCEHDFKLIQTEGP